jgi:hypothetical protein
MSPFSNLFNKQVGNLNERYKLVEATYDTFLDKFGEINAIMSMVKTDVDKDDTEANMTALAARNQRLEAEITELKLKLNNSINVELMGVRPEFCMDTQAHKSTWMTSLSESPKLTAEEEKTKGFKDKSITASGTINTVKVGMQLKKLLDAHHIDYYTFAINKLFTTKAGLNQLMSTSKNWADLNEKEKKIYRRMQRWTKATRGEIEELKQRLSILHTLHKLRVKNINKTRRLKNK